MGQTTYSEVKRQLLESSSDKEGHRSGDHKYGFIYEFLINSLLRKFNRKLKLLEIGVSRYTDLVGGTSLDVWQHLGVFYPIVAIDIEPYEKQLNTGVWFYEQDAYTDETVDRIHRLHGRFDLIIDDGSHEIADQEFFLIKYYDLLNTGGFLLCEDVHDDFFFSDQVTENDCYGIDLCINNMQSRLDDKILLKEKV